jgi:hypothetical protein
VGPPRRKDSTLAFLATMKHCFNGLFAFSLLLCCYIGCAPSASDLSSVPLPIDNDAPATSPAAHPLQQQIDDALELTYSRRLNSKEHAAWQVLHGCVAFGKEFLLRHEDKDIPAIDYLFQNGSLQGWEFEPGREIDKANNRYGLRAIVRPGSSTAQGHPDQWLGYLAAWNLPLDTKLEIQGKSYLLEDYLSQMEYDVPHNVSMEYSWTLMALAQYRPHNYEWKGADDNTWNVEKLLQLELDADLSTSPCGGAHRMVGITMAYNRFVKDGGKLDGVWLKAKNRIDSMIAKVKEYQNADGTLSSAHFFKNATSPDLGDAIAAHGHVLEFLMVAMNEDQIREPWVTRAVAAECKLFRKTKNIYVACGGLYHAASSLRLYRERMYGARSFATVETKTAAVPR